ncbi:unnamed protein product, partial [Effrenium voratum]
RNPLRPLREHPLGRGHLDMARRDSGSGAFRGGFRAATPQLSARLCTGADAAGHGNGVLHLRP